MITGAAVAVFIVVAYAVWRSFPYASGPRIEIFQPIDGSTATSPTVTVIGRALRVSSVTMNGRDISLTENGDFNETLVVFPGMNFISFQAKDRFGRVIDKNLEIFGTAVR